VSVAGKRPPLAPLSETFATSLILRDETRLMMSNVPVADSKLNAQLKDAGGV
jgi:hypothetical protein